MEMADALYWLSGLALTLGGFFFVAGTLGLLRFPDIYSRLHAVTKADTIGLGLLVAGLACQADDGRSIAMLLLIWFLVMASGAVACQLLARYHITETTIDPSTSLECDLDNDDH